MLKKNLDVWLEWNRQEFFKLPYQPALESTQGKEAQKDFSEYYHKLDLTKEYAVNSLKSTAYCMCICVWCRAHNTFSVPPRDLSVHYPEDGDVDPMHYVLHDCDKPPVPVPAPRGSSTEVRAVPVDVLGSTVSEYDANGVKLQNGWRLYTTPAGVRSYGHIMRGIRQWEHPDIASSRECTMLAPLIDTPYSALPVYEPDSIASQFDVNDAHLPGGWWRQTTTTGVHSYWNVVTDKRQWEYPGIVPSLVDADGNKLREGWTMLTPSGATPYFFNTDRRTVQWEHPGPGPSMDIPEEWNTETISAISEHQAAREEHEGAVAVADLADWQENQLQQQTDKAIRNSMNDMDARRKGAAGGSGRQV